MAPVGCARRRARSAWRIGGLALLGVLLLQGCATLPLIVPDLWRPHGAQVQIAGARGPLSPSESRAILERLRRSGQDTGIFSRHLAVEEALVGTPLKAGNAVQLLEDGPATYRAMLAAIATARHTIDLETYILEDDEVGQRFARALIERQQSGVEVRVLRDSVGTLGTRAAFFAGMQAAGITVLEFNPVDPTRARGDWVLNQRDHRKLLIVDGRIAFLGGINISSVYSGGSLRSSSRVHADGSATWRDTDLQVQGPVVDDLQRLFVDAWHAQHGPPIAPRPPQAASAIVGDTVVHAIGSSPDEPFSLMYATLLSAIASAETSVRLTNAYFVPDPQLLQALQDAARRGVDVRLILPSRTDAWFVFHAGRRHYDALLEAGVKIHERRDVILHSKTVLIDGVWATVGSTNLDWRSFLHNHELDAVILGPAFGARLDAMFERDLARSDAVTRDAWRKRARYLRVLETFADVWAYWL